MTESKSSEAQACWELANDLAKDFEAVSNAAILRNPGRNGKAVVFLASAMFSVAVCRMPNNVGDGILDEFTKLVETIYRDEEATT